MKTAAAKLLLALLAVAPLAGCGTARRLYLWTTHEIGRVRAENMLPAIRPGDIVAIDTYHYSAKPVGRFDIVAYKLTTEYLSREELEAINPDGNPDTTSLSRVIALPGETVALKRGRVYVEGVPADGPFEVINASEGFSEANDFGPVTLPREEYFLLGDNRGNSQDSRFWARPGLKKSLIVGKVVEIIRE